MCRQNAKSLSCVLIKNYPPLPTHSPPPSLSRMNTPPPSLKHSSPKFQILCFLKRGPKIALMWWKAQQGVDKEKHICWCQHGCNTTANWGPHFEIMIFFSNQELIRRKMTSSLYMEVKIRYAQGSTSAKY